MEEKYNQLEDENASDTSEKSKTGLVTPEKKVLTEMKKEPESTAPASVPSASKTEVKEDDDQDSDHEDPHGSLSSDYPNLLMLSGDINFMFVFSEGIIERIRGRSVSKPFAI